MGDIVLVDQTILQPPNGDCGAACLATLFGVPLHQVPNLDHDGWEDTVSEWAARFGLWVLNVSPWSTQGGPPGFALAGVQSRRGDWMHCVIFKDGELFHDPNPDRASHPPYTVADVKEWTFFVARDPRGGTDGLS